MEQFILEIQDTQRAKVLVQPLKQLQSAMSSIGNVSETTSEKNELKIVKTVIADILKCEISLNTMESTSQKGIIQIFDPLSHILEGIEAFEDNKEDSCIEMKCEAFEKLKVLKTPLEKVSSVLVKLCETKIKPEDKEMTQQEMKTALCALKCVVERIRYDLPPSTTCQLLAKPLGELESVVGSIENNLSPKIARRTKESVQLIHNINVASQQATALELKPGITPKNGVLSIIQISEPLLLLKEGIEAFEASNEEDIRNISESMQSLGTVSVHVEKLTAIMVKLRDIERRPEIHEIMKPQIQSALSAFKETIECVQVSIPKSQHAELLIHPLNILQCKIDFIQETVSEQTQRLDFIVANRINKRIDDIKLKTAEHSVASDSQKDSFCILFKPILEPLNQLQEAIKTVISQSDNEQEQAIFETLESFREIDISLEKLSSIFENSKKIQVLSK
ncbi:hypothetical protein WA026_018451 [Henosepilachna vigintioctopunctata]|uniref:Uncharacterized protein n=1 Tax=Henosepilachna vigintioctopunctata TaxID=420089 RepID=A0AAW1V0C3_9CUCU